jgi:uncharacterized protein (DUF2147 family)
MSLHNKNKNKVKDIATRTIETNIKKLSFDKIVVLVIGCIFSMGSIADGAPIGKWQTIDDESGKPKSIIEIYSVEDVLEGKIIELLDPDSSSICKQCKGERANKPLVGMIILWGVTAADNKQSWGGGEILDPKKGKTYSVKLSLKNSGDELKVRGFIGAPFLGRTQIWKRLSN